MKVKYPVKDATADIKEIKAELKPFGGRCAKIVGDKLEYLVEADNKEGAYEHLKEKGFVE